MTDPDRAGFRTLSELEALAASCVDPAAWAYVQGGAGEERTITANRDAFHRRTVRPRVLSGVASVDLATRLLGTPAQVPFFVAPMAYQGLVHPDAEAATARAAAKAGVLSIASTLSTLSLEAIAQAAPHGARWFQLYLQPDWAVSEELVRRAEAAGYGALVLTVDMPVLGVRDRQSLGGVAIDAPVAIGNGPAVTAPARAPVARGPSYEFRPDAAATWDVVDQLVRTTRLPVVVKGILSGDDARRAVEHGARAVIVSNHGGRQLDGTPAALEVLGEVVGAVGGRAEVYMDGGVRRGTDILIALALGARAVGLGRPILWALAVGGEAGVARYLSLLGSELATAMALAGRRSLGDLEPTVLGPMRW